jgi:hypothetical protein
MFADCCTCAATPKGIGLASCPAMCTKDACAANQIQPSEVTCSFGRCVIARSCNSTRATCPAQVPNCPAGTIPSVLDSCWGPCLPPTECRDVATCNSCGAGSVCVTNDDVGGRFIGCVAPAPDCRAGNYCTCLGACVSACGETDAGVGCFCPVC